MPRVSQKKRSTRGEKIHCQRCGGEITAGQEYFLWAFRYGGKRTQHVTCGYPRASQLTQSKLGTVYAAIEDASDTIQGSEDVSDIAQCMRDVAESAREVAEEYREAVEAMNMTGSGTDNEERADNLESFADELDSSADDVEGEEFEFEDVRAGEENECRTCGAAVEDHGGHEYSAGEDGACSVCGIEQAEHGHEFEPAYSEAERAEDENEQRTAWIEEIRTKAYDALADGSF